MEFVLLGVLVGLATVAMPGPVSVSLVHVATAQGRSSGVRAGVGILGADVVLGAAALAVVSTLGAVLSEGVFAMLQLATAVVLVGFGAVLMARPAVVQEISMEVAHPLRSFLILTTLMPSAFGGWVAMLSAMPFAHDGVHLAAFSVGVIAVSALWHPSLGLLAGMVGPHLTPRALRIGTRVGGIATLGLGVWAAFAA